MLTRGRSRRGQSILEYLLMVSLIVAAIAFVRGRATTATRAVMGNSVGGLEDAADRAVNLPVGAAETPP
jgi:hypothetical protein